jgi:hypothetical protein
MSSSVQRKKEEAAFQRKKLLVFAGFLVLIGLVVWVNQVGEENTQACISCQKQLSSTLPDSLILIGSLRNIDSSYVAYTRAISDSTLLKRVAQLSQAGPRLNLYGGYKYSAHPRVIATLDSLLIDHQDGKW